MTARLEARDLHLALGGRRIVDGVSFALSAGEIATIEGKSGSGRTTLLRILATLGEPDSGTLLLDGTDARSIAPSAFRSRVAYVLQESPMFEGSVAENVATGPRLRGVSMSPGAVDAALERVQCLHSTRDACSSRKGSRSERRGVGRSADVVRLAAQSTRPRGVPRWGLPCGRGRRADVPCALEAVDRRGGAGARGCCAAHHEVPAEAGVARY